jgi:hypothetical protein
MLHHWHKLKLFSAKDAKDAKIYGSSLNTIKLVNTITHSTRSIGTDSGSGIT